MDPSRLMPGDTTLIENIVNYLKAKGIFDEFRHECLADVDTKSSCQNLNQRIDGYTSKFLANETWNPDMNKNELRNKLRRHIDESGMLAVGADHVVEQVINPKIHPFFLPKIIEVVHQYLREQNELFNKKPDAVADCSSSEKPVADTPDSNLSKAKTTISDPIADILSFSYSKAKPAVTGSSHGKLEVGQQKHVDHKKKKEEEPVTEKRKEESSSDKKKDELVLEKKKDEKTVLESTETSSENLSALSMSDAKPQNDKEKIKKEIKVEDPEVNLEIAKKVVVKEEIKFEKKKTDDTKVGFSETVVPCEDKPITPTPIKPLVSIKKEVDKSKHKSKITDASKISNSSKDNKKLKKEPSDKSSDKHYKSKQSKCSKESSSPTKHISSSKSVVKDEKHGLLTKSKSSDSSSSKTSESSLKKASKIDSSKREGHDSKLKKYSEKSEKTKPFKSSDSKKDRSHQDLASTDKGVKSSHYSSSQDSSQGSDQEKSAINTNKEKHKYFSKHVRKEGSENKSDKISKVTRDKRKTKDSDENSNKKLKTENSKEVTISGEAEKIVSRSNSFGSTSSISSSSNASKDNITSNSDEMSEKSSKDKKKKDAKEKEHCHSPNTLPPPPPPPPPSGSLTLELTSSAEMSSMEDSQSSSESEKSSSEENSEESSSSDSESDSKSALLEALEKYVPNASADDIDDFYDIFLYSSSSSEFEGYGSLPEKKKPVESLDSDVTVSSVHTSDLSSYNDELSEDEFICSDGVEPQRRKRLTLKEAQQLLQDRVALRLNSKNKIHGVEDESKEDTKNMSLNKDLDQGASYLSSDDESSPYETRRSLRRERKVNPRYASSEYTSIFNATRESFITKQIISTKKNYSPSLTPPAEPKRRRQNSNVEKDKIVKKILEEHDKMQSVEEANMLETSEENEIQKSFHENNVQKTVEESKLQSSSEECNEQKTSEPADLKNLKKSKLLETLEETEILKDFPEAKVQKKSEDIRIQSNSEKCNIQKVSKESVAQKIKNEENSEKSTDNENSNDDDVQENTGESAVEYNSEKAADRKNLIEKESLKIPEALELDKEELNRILNLEGHGIKGYILVSDPVDDDKELGDCEQISSSDEMDSIMEKGHLLSENSKSDPISVVDPLTVQVKSKSQNASKFIINSHPVKRKRLPSDSISAKRPCSRNSVDSSGSENSTNENKPFNSAQQSLVDEKLLRLNNDIKESSLADAIKSDLFCLQRTNNNGDVLGQKEIINNSHSKTVSVPEKKSKELDTSKELNTL